MKKKSDDDAALLLTEEEDAPATKKVGVSFTTVRVAAKLARWLVVATFLLLLLAVPMYSYDLYRQGMEKHQIAYLSSGALVLLTIPVSIQDIHRHLTHWFMPEVQKYVVRIQWMVPIYATESWLSLRFRDYAIYIETMRECYESYVIYCFLYYLIALLGDEDMLIAQLKRKPPDRGKHCFPLSCCSKPWVMGYPFLLKCKIGVLQYVVLKNATAALTMLLELYDLYGTGDFSWNKGYIYITTINNCSQMWSMYCLMLFYYATREELEPWRPVGKFLCVKAVVFFTWWQSVAIAIVYKLGVIHDVGEVVVWSGQDIAYGLQNYLICIEMLMAAVAHKYSFTYKDYRHHRVNTPNGEERMPFISAFIESSVPKDIIKDLRDWAVSSIQATGPGGDGKERSDDLLGQAASGNPGEEEKRGGGNGDVEEEP